MKSGKIRVVCVDDHPVVREGLTALLSAAGDIEVVATAGTGEQAIELYRSGQPDVMIMDLKLPGITGVQAVAEIRREFPNARVVMLTTYQGDEDMYRALEAGAASYLLKDTISDDLVRVVREVHEGGRPIPKEVAARLVDRIGQPVLTAREIEVLKLIAKGSRNKEVAADLGITEDTVQVHVKNILSKLKVHDRTEAVTIALRRGILHLD